MSAATPSDPVPRRSRLLAGVLSFIAPGVGHLYVGRPRRGLVLFLTLLALQFVVVAGAFMVPPTFRAVVSFGFAILAVAAAVFLFTIVDAVRLANRGGGAPPPRWYVGAGAVIAVWIAFFAASELNAVAKTQMPWRNFSIPSASMEPTLHVGEWIIADMRHFEKHAPARGDLAIYRLPSDNETIYIKRIVGLPGDRVAFRDGHVVINGKATDEPFADFGDPKAFFNTTAEVTVPPDQIFVAGDNRANSSDSRVRQHGMVPFGNLIGRATEVFMTEDWNRAGLWIGSPKMP
ncbi:MAG: signal peptidase [Hyphomicrobiales bacterium]|jgi:signal peptidase I|nr:signal peptidase [Hyphomicrobiales bacterium]